MPPAERATTKHDVAIAETHRKASRDLMIVRGVILVAVVLASAVPIMALEGIVEPLAGKTTIVRVSLALSVVVTISVVVNVVQYVKSRSQSNELRRQRERMDRLEP